MATPTRKARHGAFSPATDPNAPVADGVATIVVHIKISGTPSAVNADFTTLAGTSLTAASAQLSWDRG